MEFKANIICMYLLTVLLQSGRTALHWAASGWSKEQFVEALIDSGAYVNIVDEVSYY